MRAQVVLREQRAAERLVRARVVEGGGVVVLEQREQLVDRLLDVLELAPPARGRRGRVVAAGAAAEAAAAHGERAARGRARAREPEAQAREEKGNGARHFELFRQG